jgi:hypothetical protein
MPRHNNMANWQAMVAQIPGMYLGKSFWRKTVVAKIPPTPPAAMMTPVETARLVWLVMLLEL